MDNFKLYAVLGKPVFFSRSPLIYNTAFQSWGIKARYLRLSADNEVEALRTAEEMGIFGLNITSPFKETIFPHLDRFDLHSQKIRAVNTIIRKNGLYLGYNTDYIGIIRSLLNQNIIPKGKKALILGAGGAARAAAYGLHQAGLKTLLIANRNKKRAEEVASNFQGFSLSLDEVKSILPKVDIIISCIPDLSAVLNPKALPSHLVILEAGYSKSISAHIKKAHQPLVISGLEWLLYQALESLFLFTKRRTWPTLRAKIKSVIYLPRAIKTNLAFTGFMASGKSTIAQLVASELGYKFIDTDQEIEKVCGCSIADIFSKAGEEKFRKIESSLIIKLLQNTERTVFSLGGGAVTNPKTARLLKESCQVIWIWVSPKQLLQRASSSLRPLLSQNLEGNKLERLLSSRIPAYASVSDLVITNPQGMLQTTVKRIINEIN